MAGSASNLLNFGILTSSSSLSAAPGSRINIMRSMAQPFRSEPDTLLSKKLDWISEREGEDAHLTGGTRSLHRRLLALNLHESGAISTTRTARSRSLSA